MSTQADQGRQASADEASTRGWLESLLRRFLVRLIVDCAVELYARTKTDPEFQRRVAGAFAGLDNAKTQEENDAAALAIQHAIES